MPAPLPVVRMRSADLARDDDMPPQVDDDMDHEFEGCKLQLRKNGQRLPPDMTCLEAMVKQGWQQGEHPTDSDMLMQVYDVEICPEQSEAGMDRTGAGAGAGAGPGAGA